MIMNRRLLIVFVFLMGINWFYAQRPAKDRIKALKVAYLTEQLSLTKEEAQQFWPVYNEHEDALEDIRKKERQQFGSRFEDMSNVSENEAAKMIDRYINLQAEKLEIENEFIKGLQGVIPSKKVIQLFRAENNFKKRLLQQYRKRQGGG
ncbi:hypothetical protein HME9304_00091 [Flagellimonas maritima]|uniref:Sensor of ECF-type sigma factor n=2 Tax=Flagellimonas maritima TaxID=1383885 RepID=A0A2Z4LND2_9FLAO|nr:hypothetical protein HME9304_00091 [Allomuricauda aurantiaca]